VLIPSFYATSPRTRSLRLVRVPSDQNTRWRLPFHFTLIKDKNFLSPHICQIGLHFRFKVGLIFSPRCRTHATLPFLSSSSSLCFGYIFLYLFLLFIIILLIIFYFYFYFCVGTQKWVTTNAPLYNTYGAGVLCSKFYKDKQN